MSIFSDIGHAFSSVAQTIGHTVGGAVTSAGRFVNKNPIGKSLFPEIGAFHAIQNVAKGKNVAESVGKGALEGVSSAAYLPNKALTTAAGSSAGKTVVGFADSLTGGTATRALAVPTLQTKISEGQDYSKSDIFQAGKSQAIAAATVGASAAAGGAAAGALGTAGGVFAGSQVAKGVGNAFNKGDVGSVLSAAAPTALSAAGIDMPFDTSVLEDLGSMFGSSFLGGGQPPVIGAPATSSGLLDFSFAPDSSGPDTLNASPGYSGIVIVAAGLFSLYLLSKRRSAA